eukprot:TRINITY_DN2767_c1_g2_i1.p1 TRINITY_DN2767_c1_g2~~TRINITY_DN2767_c1_g2_i1.p1  ORF type:complete len:584 (-),score=68.51 TRINITY_DN2767_c1_g2_i1:154-1905(-)
MIYYDPGRFHLWTILQLRGSVFPTAIMMAVPPTMLCASIFYAASVRPEEFAFIIEDGGLVHNGTAYSAFSFALGFLLVFRTQTAYSRFWEGTSLMQVLRGQWVGAFGSLIAFSSTARRPAREIELFRSKLARMFSALHAAAIEYVATEHEDQKTDVMGLDDFDERTLAVLHETDSEARLFIIVQWIQQTILFNIEFGLITVATPIVSRVFQDISQGVITLSNAKKVSETPFPFPYAQLLSVATLMHMFMTPLVFAGWMRHPALSVLFTFVSVFFFASMNLIAAEIEHPFGGDANDIDCKLLQSEFNRIIGAMLDPDCSSRPELNPNAEKCRRKLMRQNSRFDRRHREDGTSYSSWEASSFLQGSETSSGYASLTGRGFAGSGGRHPAVSSGSQGQSPEQQTSTSEEVVIQNGWSQNGCQPDTGDQQYSESLDSEEGSRAKRAYVAQMTAHCSPHQAVEPGGRSRTTSQDDCRLGEDQQLSSTLSSSSSGQELRLPIPLPPMLTLNGECKGDVIVSRCDAANAERTNGYDAKDKAFGSERYTSLPAEQKPLSSSHVGGPAAPEVTAFRQEFVEERGAYCKSHQL